MSMQAIVLAAGQGTRMNHPELPKVLVPLNGRPIIAYVLDTLHQVGIREPVVVVKYRAELVRAAFPEGRFADQGDRTGTGAAALVPYTALKRMVGEGKTIPEIARHFQVSRALVEFRIKVSRLWDDYAAKVFNG